jgi:hypothetical protein
VENIDIALNSEQGVFTKILILNLFKTIDKRNTYENGGKQNYSKKNSPMYLTQESYNRCDCIIGLMKYRKLYEF